MENEDLLSLDEIQVNRFNFSGVSELSLKEQREIEGGNLLGLFVVALCILGGIIAGWCLADSLR